VLNVAVSFIRNTPVVDNKLLMKSEEVRLRHTSLTNWISNLSTPVESASISLSIACLISSLGRLSVCSAAVRLIGMLDVFVFNSGKEIPRRIVVC
jgi:hypothetical protein